MKVKNILAVVGLALAMALPAKAQDVQMDSTLRGRSVFSLLPSKAKGGKADVKVHQSQAILNAVNSQIASNSSRNVVTYSVRIYNDNSQNARNTSEAVLNSFRSNYPGIPATRSYNNPFFKVTVGNFRTRSEALKLFNELKGSYPSAFILKESSSFPALSQGVTHDLKTDVVRK